jgi:hypothetical protein
MSIAWTTVLVLLLLLPGVFFFIGLATHERYSREIVRMSAAGEVALAISVALLLHALLLTVLRLAGFDIAHYLTPLVQYDRIPPELAIRIGFGRLIKAACYVLAAAAFGYLAGWAVAKLILSGPLRFLATHKWIYDLIKFGGGNYITAYILSNVSEKDKRLMYKGFLHEFYLNAEGGFSYVVLTSCSSYFMTSEDDRPKTGEPQPILAGSDASTRAWNYFVVEGGNIANILFHRTPGVLASDAGLRALDEAVNALQAEIAAAPAPESPSPEALRAGLTHETARPDATRGM